MRLRSDIRLCGNLWTSSAPPRCSACSVQNHARYFLSIVKKYCTIKASVLPLAIFIMNFPKLASCQQHAFTFFLQSYVDEQFRNWRNTRPMFWWNFELCILKSRQDKVDFSISSQCDSMGMTYFPQGLETFDLCYSSFLFNGYLLLTPLKFN